MNDVGLGSGRVDGQPGGLVDDSTQVALHVDVVVLGHAVEDLRGRERGERRVMESRERSEERNATFLSVRQYFSASMSRSSGQRVKHVERTKSAMPGSKALLLGISGKLK